jgi:hypothetical protein
MECDTVSHLSYEFKKRDREKIMAYFRVYIYHRVPGRNDVMHYESPTNTQPPERDLQPVPPKNATKRDKHSNEERWVFAKVLKICNLNYALNLIEMTNNM